MARLCIHCQLATAAGSDFCCLGCELAHGIRAEASRDLSASAGRITFAALLAMVVMMLSLFLYAQDVYGASDADGFGWLRQGYRATLLLLSTPVMVMLGWPLARAAWRRLRSGVICLELLIFTAATAAYGLSCVSTLRGDGAVYFDTATAALLLATVGRYLEARVRTRAAAALAPLASVQNTQLWSGPREDALQLRDPAAIARGDVVRIEPLQASPVDVLALGPAQLDLSAVCGEPLPRWVQAGEVVAAGAVPIERPLLGRAHSTVRSSTLRRTEDLTRALSSARGRTARLADQLARWLTPLVGMLALATLLVWWREASLGVGLSHALAVLLVACPCTYGVVTPLVLWLTLDRAAGRGIALRDAATIERLAAVQHMAFDKTGTLTEPMVATLAWRAEGAEEALLWRMVARLERGSHHPIARAMVAGAERGAQLSGKEAMVAGAERAAPSSGEDAMVAGAERATPSSGKEAMVGAVSSGMADEHSDEGLQARWARIGAGVAGRDGYGRVWRLGSARWVSGQYEIGDELWPEEGAGSAAEGSPEEGSAEYTCVYLSCEGRLVARFRVGERLRAAAPVAIAQLAGLGVGASISSGDPSEAPLRIAQQLGIRGQRGMRAADKAAALTALPRPLAAVGDGSNDGPLMAGADVSIAVSAAAPLARNMAEVVLLDADLDALPWLLMQARRALQVARRALLVATLYNLIFVAMAALGMLRPVWAGLSMLLSSLLTLAAVVASLGHDGSSLDTSIGEKSASPGDEGRAGLSTTRSEVARSQLPSFNAAEAGSLWRRSA